MKKTIILLVLISLSLSIKAQNTDQNFTKVIAYKVATTTPIPTPTIEQANVQVTYYDGLGRSIQQIAHKQSASGKDIVTHIEYDQFGRQIKDYLPFTKTASLDYLDANSASSEINSYYQYYNGGTSNPYSEKQLESSPLNRVFKQAAPGDNWAMSNNHVINFEYKTNNDNEVKRFTANAEWNLPLELYDITLIPNNHYSENQLYKTITKDENWTSGNNNTTQEFKNKQGQVILKRTFNGTDIFDTYYVYDQFGNLTYVIPPLAEGNPTIDNLEKLCYQYKYDSRNRLVEKKLPGKQWEFIVYNKVNLPVATGPAFTPFGGTNQGWMITKYDALSRPISTGWYNGGNFTPTSAGRKSYQEKMNTVGGSWYEGINHNFTINPIDNIPTYYTDKVYPNCNTNPYKLLTINYYDNYNFPNTNLINYTVTGSTLATNVKGLTTGSWVRVLEGATNTNGEISYTLYDTKYRPVRSYTQNYLGGFTQVDSDLDDFNGKVLSTKTTHKRTANDTPLVITETFEYTAQDRLYKHKHQIYGQPETTLTENHYDELGQLILKTTGDGLQDVDYRYNVRGWLTDINDEEIASSEDGFVNLGAGDLFAFKIRYDNLLNKLGNSKSLYNGNISETFWKTTTDNTERQYGYEYDNLNRLKKANYIKNPFYGGEEHEAYDESLQYDKNGNIINLIRYGKIQSDTQPIDNLTYTYIDGTNQLKGVYDATTSPQGFNDVNLGAIDFEYDANGNMIKDHNKGITLITYNHLNLPTTIQFGSVNSITYIYNAIGQKVLKKVRTGNEYANTDYLTGFQYRSSYTETQGNQSTAELQYFPTTEGYVQQKDGRYFYVYHYTDHLGNIRLSYSLDPETQMIKIMEENHYYPFGLKHEFYNTATMKFAEKMAPNTNEAMIVLEQANNFVGDGSYNYKYNGKELQDELGLNITAMDFRMYDNALGRFHSMDKMTDILPSLSPYRFAFNNPVKWNDPSGLLESGDPDSEEPAFGFVGRVIVLTAKGGSSSSEITRPAQFNYSLMDYSSPHRRVSMNDYNKAKGTNYSSFDDYYFNEKYKPAYKQNISNIHSATNSAAVTVLTTAAVLTGSAYLMPIVASAAPTIQSFTATALTNPLVQDKLLDVGSNVASQLWVNSGDVSQVNIAEATMSAVNGPGATAIGEMVNINANSISEGNMFERYSNAQTGVAVAGGLGSYAFGQATDNYLSGTGWKGKVVGLYFKFLVESASNAAPNLVPDEK
ncbi:DUF6443 domain-containing protein [uncultured Flavobacterium sp.]|uniref:DUF6443 domain-containing protein n=1 Tax=uncultured Flavobacterium sp. TaxID=165435 RepID=UPI0030EF28B9